MKADSDTIQNRDGQRTEDLPAGAAGRGRLSLRDRAYTSIKNRIITLRYRPGEYLNEARVSEELGIGRTPVHQALNRLMLEGMVEVIPRKGVIVHPVSLHEVLEIVETRLAVEPYAVDLAARRAEAAHVRQLAGIIERAKPLVASRDVEGLMELDREFHGTIAAAARNTVLGEVLRNLHDRSLRFWFISLNDATHLSSVQAEHTAILEAIQRGNGPDAAERMRSHIRAFGDNVSRQI